MIEEKLISQARSIFHELKKNERNSINPYIAFVSQVINLIQQHELNNITEISKFIDKSYPRPRMNYQWRNFNKILQTQIPTNADRDTLLRIFGYLKWILTIEAKNEYDSRPKRKPGRQDSRRNHHRR